MKFLTVFIRIKLIESEYIEKKGIRHINNNLSDFFSSNESGEE